MCVSARRQATKERTNTNTKAKAKTDTNTSATTSTHPNMNTQKQLIARKNKLDHAVFEITYDACFI